MAIQVRDVIVIDAVLLDLQLLLNDHDIKALSAEIGMEIIPELTPQGSVLRLPRNRMFLETFHGRTQIGRDYPSAKGDTISIIEFATKAIAAMNPHKQVPSAFGFNIKMVYNQDSGENAISYLGHRLFAPMNDLHEEWEVGRRVWEIDIPRRSPAVDDSP